MTELGDREIVVSRRIAAPREKVFAAFTEVRHLSQWWGPTGFTTTTRTFDFTVGGVWEFTMHGPDGTDYPEWIQWQEITRPERITLRHGEYAADPNAFTTILSFTTVDTATDVEMRTVFATGQQRDEAVEKYHAVEGGNGTLAGLDAYLTTKSD